MLWKKPVKLKSKNKKSPKYSLHENPNYWARSDNLEQSVRTWVKMSNEIRERKTFPITEVSYIMILFSEDNKTIGYPRYEEVDMNWIMAPFRWRYSICTQIIFTCLHGLINYTLLFSSPSPFWTLKVLSCIWHRMNGIGFGIAFAGILSDHVLWFITNLAILNPWSQPKYVSYNFLAIFSWTHLVTVQAD